MDKPTEKRLKVAMKIARAAGDIQRDRYETPLEIQTKSVDIDLVTEVDRACEGLAVAKIEEMFPEDSILAEEGGGTDRKNALWRWIIDPLDGTTNYAHGYPRFCISIGIEREKERTLAVIYDPIMDELYHAIRGGGAFRNNLKISVSQESLMERSLLATGFAYDQKRSKRENVEYFAAFLQTARAMRRDGSAALDLCYVASGRLDGFWELKLSPWDVAAGYLLVEEAGGRISNLAGGAAFGSGREVVASNGIIHDSMLKVINTVHV